MHGRQGAQQAKNGREVEDWRVEHRQVGSKALTLGSGSGTHLVCHEQRQASGKALTLGSGSGLLPTSAMAASNIDDALHAAARGCWAATSRITSSCTRVTSHKSQVASTSSDKQQLTSHKCRVTSQCVPSSLACPVHRSGPCPCIECWISVPFPPYPRVQRYPKP